jgi:4-hydroxybenzoate polyprenyltransferase
MRGSVVDLPGARGAARYLSCLRQSDVVTLQGSPVLGAVFAMPRAGAEFLAPIALLAVADVLLVAHIFMLNDWANLRADLADPNKSADVFTARGVETGEVGRLTAALLAAGLALFGALGATALALALAIAGLSALYSLPTLDWKGRPILNTLAHLVGGALHFLLGYGVVGAIDGRTVVLSTFVGLTFAAGHLTQETRDWQGDATSAIRTNAVAFGRRRVFIASVILFSLAHALLFTLAVLGVLPRVLAVLVALCPAHLYWSLEALHEGLTYAAIHRLQTRYRMLYGVIGLAIALCR